LVFQERRETIDFTIDDINFVKVYVHGEVGVRQSATFLFDNKKFKVMELNKNP